MERPPPQPMLEGARRPAAQLTVYLIVVLPFVGLVVAVPMLWGWGITLTDVLLAGATYLVTMLGVTVGFHRYFTHRSFRARRPLRIALAVLGSLAVQGPIGHWVANHRRHHAFADHDGDPHSPWQFGTSAIALLRGFWHAHMGWMFSRDLTNQRRFAPDIIDDRDLRLVHHLFIPLAVLSVCGPAGLGALLAGTWQGAVSALVWAGLIRVGLVHHVSWSVNSICHLIGERPFKARDRAANFAPLAIASMGEAWHNLHHADPSSARHGVERGQIDIAARVIWLMERLGWAYDVRWPTPERIRRLRRSAGL
ncbi:acyl-CoA desaturase [Dactylosporangium sp. NPDC051541]|uniref:acyl-CoA desaturase n=1 Tax=Dactylosporangium sp. NPDC051541 TaxID=3363977 RepID=UPI0037A03AD0